MNKTVPSVTACHQPKNVYVTPGNLARLNAIAEAMLITPEQLLNNFVLAYMEHPQQYVVDMFDPNMELEGGYPEEGKEMYNRLSKFEVDDWQCDPLE